MKSQNYLLAVMISLSTIQYGCTSKAKEEQTQTEIPVKVITVSSVKLNTDNTYIGVVEESKEAQLSFQVSGNVAQIFVSPGSKVQQGQLLATLDKSRLENNYRATQSLLNQAQDAFDRMKVMYDNKSLPEIKYIEVKSNLEQAKASASIAKKDLDDCQLYAPFNGVIGVRSIEQGTNVGAGTPLLSLLEVDKVKVKIAVPEKEVAKVKLGDEASIFIGAQEKYYSGKIIEKGIVANPLSHAYDLKIELDNPHHEIIPGMGCDVKLSNDTHTGYILPISAIHTTPNDQRYVWIVDKNYNICVKPIIVGEITSTGVIINHGVENGDKVVIEGARKIQEGSIVRID